MAGASTVPMQAGALPRRDAGLFPILCLLFFASGACGLVYQQLWLRELSLVFGVTVHAVSTALAAFFGGLASGAALAGRWARRTTRPLHWYGVAEVVIGVLAILTPAALYAVERVYVGAAGVLPDSVGVLTAIRFVLSFAVLLVPATLMGATLPLVVSSSAVRDSWVGERISVLYATNTAGAIAGTVLAGFWLVGRLGVGSSFRLAAAVNVIIGLVALGCSRRFERDSIDVPDAGPDASPSWRGPEMSRRDRRVLLWVFATSGFASIALEVVWFRVLVLYVESDTYAFTIILAVVLTGIAAGGYLAAAVMHRWGARLALLAIVELAIGVTTLTSFAFLSKSFTVNGRYGELFSALGEDLRFVVVAGALTVGPTALLLGVAFPIGLALWTRGAADAAETGRRAGIFYSVNVAAGIAGSIAAGFLLVPFVGTRATLVVLAIALLAGGVLLMWILPRSALLLRSTIAAAAVVAVIAAVVVGVPPPFAAALTYRYPGERMLWYDEGPQTTVSIHETPTGRA